jgi:hypothetical protein
MGKHSIAAEMENGARMAQQVQDEAKAAFYADDEIWDHEFCADGDACDNNCPYTND